MRFLDNIVRGIGFGRSSRKERDTKSLEYMAEWMELGRDERALSRVQLRSSITHIIKQKIKEFQRLCRGVQPREWTELVLVYSVLRLRVLSDLKNTSHATEDLRTVNDIKLKQMPRAKPSNHYLMSRP